MLPLVWIAAGVAVATGIILSKSDDESKDDVCMKMKFREVSEEYVRDELAKHGKTLPQ